MSISRDVLEAAHKRCIFNKEEVLQSEFCGCFYCMTAFKPVENMEWSDEENPKGMTAICPNCGIDSVVGDKSGFPVTDQNFLKAMNEMYF